MITRIIIFALLCFGFRAEAQVPVVQNISNLVARQVASGARPAVQPLVLVLGAREAGDWLPRTYRWDPTNTLPANTTNYSRVGTNAVGRWVYDANGEIGYWTVSSTADRDAIPMLRRTEGMLVYVQGSSRAVYRLDPGLVSWTEVPVVSASDWETVAVLPTQAEVFQKVSTYSVPLTLRQSSSEVLAGFTRNSQAFDPELGSHVSSNVLRAFPIAFGAKFAQAALIERPATNSQYLGPPEGQLTAVRYTISTNVIAGPFGTSIQAITYTDTADTNSHYAYIDGPANSAPVQVGLLVCPNNLTNLLYQMHVAAATNAGWNITMSATLDGRDVLPATTIVMNGSATYHDGGFVRLDNGWYYAWLTVSLSSATTARAYISPANFLVSVGRTNFPAFYTAGYSYNSTPAALETPVYPLSKTNSALIKSKPQDVYSYTILQPIKSGEGSLILWLKNGFKQPTNATLIEASGFSVGMTRSALNVTMPDQGAGVSLSASVPQLSTFGERLVTITWSTNGLRAFIDGALVGASSPPTGAFAFGYEGVIGRAAADTNFWNGHISAAYLGTTMTDEEVSLLPKVVGPPDELETFKSLASRSGDEGVNPPLRLGTVVWSPRFMGDSLTFPYVATNKARELHATASLWVYFTTNDTRVAGLKAVTPTIGGAFTPDVPTQDANALMVDFVTGQSMKPQWYAFPAKWSGCVNRPLFKQALINYLSAYYDLGITIVQNDDPGGNQELALPFLSYRYGTGDSLGTLSSPTRGCFCPDCQASAAAIGYGTLTTSNLRAFHSQTQTNYFSWLGGVVRSNAGMRISANLGTSSLLLNDAYQEGRYHFPMVEQHLSDSYPDKFVSSWSTYRGRPIVSTFAVNTLSAPNTSFGSSDRTRRWMAASYAMGSLPILPWDVYHGDSITRTFAARESIVDISGFVRAKGEHLFEGYDLAGAIGETLSIPADTTIAAWASTNQVLVTVRHRDSDNRRVIHCVDFRDTPSPFTLSYWTPIVGNGAATIYQPATYNVTNQDYAVATGDFTQLVTSSAATVTTSNSVASISMGAGLWRIIEVEP